MAGRLPAGQTHGRRSLFVAMLVTFPCPIIALLGFGLLPVSALALPFVSFVVGAVENPLALIGALVVIVYAAVNGALLYWLAGVLSRRLSSDRFQPAGRARRLTIAALMVLALLPVYSFDHMDGASSRWCNWYQLHLGFFRVAEPCGDFHR